MKEVELNCSTRELKTKGDLKKVRNSGGIPGILYGERKESVPLTFSGKELQKALSQAGGRNALFHIKVQKSGGDTSALAMIKEVQLDPVKDNIIHADFQIVSLSKKIQVEVPIKTQGEAVGVKEGGILEILARTLSVRCLPKDMPDVIQVDVSALKIGHALHVRDIQASAGVEILETKDRPVLIVTVPSEIKEEEVAAGPEVPVAEPEVIGEKERLERKAAKEAEAGKEGAAKEPAKEGAGAKEALKAAKEAPKADDKSKAVKGAKK